MKRLTNLAVAGAFLASAETRSAAAEMIHLKDCSAAAEIAVSVVYKEQQAIDTNVRPSLLKEAAPAMANSVHLLAVGPVLGSMDGRAIAFTADCSSGNVHVSATVVRASGYVGAVLKFAMWRPLVRLDFPGVAKYPKMSLTWRMVSDAGEIIPEGDLPTGVKQHYPFTLTVTP